MDGFLVRMPGLLTSIQDTGRFGYQRSGLSPSGAMDLRSLRLANILVDNPEDEAGLEITIMGPELEFLHDQVIAITGADLSPTCNGKLLPMYQAVSVAAGDVLRFGARKKGCRAYIAFTGGLDVEPVMGSRATLLRNKIGPLNGRGLAKGDRIGFRDPKAVLPHMGRRHHLPDEIRDKELVLRVVMGPQDDFFTDEGIRTFLSEEGYTVTQEFNRQGYRLTGKKIQHKTNGDIVSDGIAMGAIQIPSNGLPIIMLAERQSTGGYTKIANVITVDLPKIAQCMVGAKIRFQAVSVEEAQELMRQEARALEAFREKLQKEEELIRRYRVTLNGKSYLVELEEFD